MRILSATVEPTDAGMFVAHGAPEGTVRVKKAGHFDMSARVASVDADGFARRHAGGRVWCTLRNNVVTTQENSCQEKTRYVGLS